MFDCFPITKCDVCGTDISVGVEIKEVTCERCSKAIKDAIDQALYLKSLEKDSDKMDK